MLRAAAVGSCLVCRKNNVKLKVLSLECRRNVFISNGLVPTIMFVLFRATRNIFFETSVKICRTLIETIFFRAESCKIFYRCYEKLPQIMKDLSSHMKKLFHMKNSKLSALLLRINSMRICPILIRCSKDGFPM